MLAGIASSLATSQNKSNPQSYQHLCKAWGSARISAELSKKITYSQIEQITKNPPHTQCFGVPIEYLCICVHIQKYIYTHTHTHKDSNRKGRRMKSHYIKPLNQNKIYTDLRQTHRTGLISPCFFAAQDPEVDLLDIWKLITWQFILTHSSAELWKLVKSTPTIPDWFANSKARNTVR